jgi:hypothetical protein
VGKAKVDLQFCLEVKKNGEVFLLQGSLLVQTKPWVGWSVDYPLPPQ